VNLLDLIAELKFVSITSTA